MFSLLDHSRTHPLVWVGAPPGAGKTTLIASWLEARHASAIWYQLDSTDADPATFFYYLGLAAQPLLRDQKRRGVPPLSPELDRDPASFARRYFRNLFASLAPGTIITLDNLQEIPDHSPLHMSLANAAGEIPPGSLLLLVSRDAPGTSFARLQANRIMRVVDADDLKLTLPETRLMLHERADLQDPDAAELHELCQGWAAGLTLLIERRRHGDPLCASAISLSLQNIFDYFAAEIFDRIAESDRNTLLRLCWLPEFSASLAVQASGNDDAGRLVERLYRQN
ncbi:MAG TPA: hypothetical protein VEV20_05250, partial [Burkholderiales bacterium]|nr:hypothetical protein [Burkholderiales bacterium]